jgi:hypothetical protein
MSDNTNGGGGQTPPEAPRYDRYTGQPLRRIEVEIEGQRYTLRVTGGRRGRFWHAATLHPIVE